MTIMQLASNGILASPWLEFYDRVIKGKIYIKVVCVCVFIRLLCIVSTKPCLHLIMESSADFYISKTTFV